MNSHEDQNLNDLSFSRILKNIFVQDYELSGRKTVGNNYHQLYGDEI